MKKRLILFILSLSFILGLSINVNAATEITVDTNTCLEDEPGSCLITNEENILFSNDDYGVPYTYKTIDSYYNTDSNVIIYQFTETFKTFLASTKDTENDYSELTVDEYMNITGATEEEMESGSTQLVNDLDKLYTLFGVYVKKNNVIPTNCADVTNYGSCVSHISSSPVGSYFVMKSLGFTEYIFAPMVANLQFEVDETGEWILNPVEIVPKVSQVGLVNGYIDTVENNLGTESFFNTSRKIGDNIKFVIVYNVPKYPVNALNKTFTQTTTLAVGLDYVNAISSIEFEGVGQNFKNDGNGNIIDSDTNEVVATLSYVDKTISINFDTDKILVDSLNVIVNTTLNSNAVIGTTGNVFNLKYEYANDAFSENVQTDDSADMIKIYTYGLKLSLTDKDNNTVFLPGAEFKLYDADDTEFKNALGTITIGEDGTATFVGVSAGSYILKQTKASTGYHMNDDYTFSFTSTDIDEEGYYSLSLTNQKYSLLPFTGGAGTLTYTLWGLLLIGLSALGVVLYKKRQRSMVGKIEL